MVLSYVRAIWINTGRFYGRVYSSKRQKTASIFGFVVKLLIGNSILYTYLCPFPESLFREEIEKGKGDGIEKKERKTNLLWRAEACEGEIGYRWVEQS